MTLLQALKQLRVMAASGCVPDTKEGICLNVYNLCGKYYLAKQRKLQSGWQYHSGDDYFPVAGLWEFFCSPYIKKWQGEQLDLRLSLINHMINKLERLNEPY